MRWTVTGADRRTGEDRVITVDADGEEQAIAAASVSGLFIASLEAETIQEGPGDDLAALAAAVARPRIRHRALVEGPAPNQLLAIRLGGKLAPPSSRSSASTGL